MPGADVHIVVNGEELRDWRSYEIESDLLQPADSFSFTAANTSGKNSERFNLFDSVSVVIDGVVQMQGYVDEITRGATADGGPTLTVVGRDQFGQLVDVCAEPKQYRSVSLLRLAEEIAETWVPSWEVENERNRVELLRVKRELASLRRHRDSLNPGPVADFGPRALVVKEELRKARLAELKASLFQHVKIEPGERVYEVLERAARKLGYLVWAAVDGSGIIGKPNYNQQPLFELQHHPSNSARSRANNVEQSEVSERGAERYSSYRFLGTAGNTRQNFGVSSRLDATVEDTEVPLTRPLIETVDSRNQQDTVKQATRDMQRRRFDGLELGYTVRGHRNRGLLWQIDTLARVHDTVNGIEGSYYVVSRRFVGNDQGQTTQVRLRRPGTLLP